MGRTPCCDKNGLKKGPWTPEEDQKLIDYIQKHGYGNWRTLPKNAGLQRCGKSCRLRWTNYLRPDIKRGRFSFEEEETIIQLHSILGNKWSAIAARLPGRTDNEIKNYWNTHIRKRLLRMGIDPVTHSPRLDLLDLSSILTNSFYNSSQMNISRMLGVQPLVNPELLRLATSLMSETQTTTFNHNMTQEDQSHFHHQNQFFNHQIDQNQLVQPNQIDQDHIHYPCASLPHDQAQILNQLQQNLSDYGDWQCTGMENNQDFVPIPGNYYSSDQAATMDNSVFYYSNDNNNFSALATPSSTSSPTPLNSNSTTTTTTYVNGSSTEDERESYCSDVLKFEIPDILDVVGEFTCNF